MFLSVCPVCVFFSTPFRTIFKDTFEFYTGRYIICVKDPPDNIGSQFTNP